MPEQRATTRVTEAKRVPVEKALGRGPVGPPPARVNPAPQASSDRGSSASSKK